MMIGGDTTPAYMAKDVLEPVEGGRAPADPLVLRGHRGWRSGWYSGSPALGSVRPLVVENARNLGRAGTVRGAGKDLFTALCAARNTSAGASSPGYCWPGSSKMTVTWRKPMEVAIPVSMLRVLCSARAVRSLVRATSLSLLRASR